MDTGEMIPISEDAEATSIEPLVDNTIINTPINYVTPLQLSQDNKNDLVSTTNAMSRNTALLTPERGPLVGKTIPESPRHRNLIQLAESETDYADVYDSNR